MEVKVDTFTVRTATVNPEQLKAILSTACGFQDSITTVVPSEHYKGAYLLEERKSTFQMAIEANYPHDPFTWQESTILQLGEWQASRNQGNGLAGRAHDLIVAMAKKIADLEAQLEETK